jgi:hypothetical protein
VAELAPGDVITTTLVDGDSRSRVEQEEST